MLDRLYWLGKGESSNSGYLLASSKFRKLGRSSKQCSDRWGTLNAHKAPSLGLSIWNLICHRIKFSDGIINKREQILVTVRIMNLTTSISRKFVSSGTLRDQRSSGMSEAQLGNMVTFCPFGSFAGSFGPWRGVFLVHGLLGTRPKWGMSSEKVQNAHSRSTIVKHSENFRRFWEVAAPWRTCPKHLAII